MSDFGAPPPPSYGYAGTPAMPAPGGQPAGLGVRLVARLLDGLILGIPFGIIYSVLVLPAIMVAAKNATPTVDPTTGAVTGTTADPAAMGAIFGTAGLVYGIFFLIIIAYEVVLTATRGGTFGKQIMKLRVISTETGGNPSFGAALLRWLLPFVGSFACGIGQLVVYISPAFDNTGLQQGWHDKVAKTRVVKL